MKKGISEQILRFLIIGVRFYEYFCVSFFVCTFEFLMCVCLLVYMCVCVRVCMNA